MPKPPLPRPLTRSLPLLLVMLLPALDAYSAGPAPRLEARIRAYTLEAAERRSDLVRDEALVGIARGHSRAMHDDDTLAHELNGIGPAERFARYHRTLFGLVSENVAMQKHWPAGTDQARRMVEGWMNSPGHRANILADYELFEVGCHGDRRVMYCTQLFVRSPTRLAHPVQFLQPPSGELDIDIEPARRAGTDRRVSLAPAGAGSSGSSVPVTDGAAMPKVPAQTGLYQLRLWTQYPEDPSRYRIIAGPFVCARESRATPGDQPWPAACRP